MINLEKNIILVVEDDDMNFIYLKQIFKIIKGSIERAKNGYSAIDICKNNDFDLILMDIQLPDINGYEVTRAIREFNKDIPIIAQTAAKSPGEINKALEAGCNDVLIKPFKLEELSQAIAKIL